MSIYVWNSDILLGEWHLGDVSGHESVLLQRDVTAEEDIVSRSQ
jgi:hypothetical protein